MKIWPIIQAIEDADAFSVVTMGINDVILRTREGWTFTVFIDAGDVDYIEWIESPDGERYDPWAKDGLRCLADLCFFPGVLSKIEAVIHAHPDWGWR